MIEFERAERLSLLAHPELNEKWVQDLIAKDPSIIGLGDLELRQKDMAAFVSAQKDRLSPARTIGLGYSNGANILAAVAFAAPELFDALVLMHPLIPCLSSEGRAGRRPVVCVPAAATDQTDQTDPSDSTRWPACSGPICPPAQTAALERYFERQGADTVVEWHQGGHELRLSEVDALLGWSASRTRS